MRLGLDPDTAKKISCGFGAGISKTGNICGAVSGAIMVIGLKYREDKYKVMMRPPRKPGHWSGNSYRNSPNAMVRSAARNCSGITLVYQISMRKARDSQLFVTKCPVLVGDAAAILEEIF